MPVDRSFGFVLAYDDKEDIYLAVPSRILPRLTSDCETNQCYPISEETARQIRPFLEFAYEFLESQGSFNGEYVKELFINGYALRIAILWGTPYSYVVVEINDDNPDEVHVYINVKKFKDTKGQALYLLKQALASLPSEP
ncbi:MAG: hypothetical protein QXR92_04285 [Fervidicoccaceae archaeon]|uniref:hypothetical protein n=2 Tax=Sulfolobales TaxID=2281 RepID=UPI003165797A